MFSSTGYEHVLSKIPNSTSSRKNDGPREPVGLHLAESGRPLHNMYNAFEYQRADSVRTFRGRGKARHGRSREASR